MAAEVADEARGHLPSETTPLLLSPHPTSSAHQTPPDSPTASAQRSAASRPRHPRARTVTFLANPVSETYGYESDPHRRPSSLSPTSSSRRHSHHHAAPSSLSSTMATGLGSGSGLASGGAPVLSALNSKLRRRNSSGGGGLPAGLHHHPAAGSLTLSGGGGLAAGPAPLPKVGPQRSTKNAQKLKLLPNPETGGEDGPGPGDDDQETGRDVYSQYGRIKDPSARRDAARLGKADRDRLPRVTAFCTANKYDMADLMRFLKGRGKSRGASPKLIDECIYTPFGYSFSPGPAISAPPPPPPTPPPPPPQPSQAENGHDHTGSQRQQQQQQSWGESRRRASRDAVSLRETITEESEGEGQRDDDMSAPSGPSDDSEDPAVLRLRHKEDADAANLDMRSQDSGYAEDFSQDDASASVPLLAAATNDPHPNYQPVMVDHGRVPLSPTPGPHPHPHGHDSLLPPASAPPPFLLPLPASLLGPPPATAAAIPPDFFLDTEVHTPEVFLFEYGVVVIWGMSAAQEERFLKEIARFEVEKLAMDDVQAEYFNFYYTREYQPRIYNDFITLRDKSNYMTKLAISHGLAQSVKTSLFEELLASEIETCKDLPAQIAITGTIALTRSEINMKIGELFILRINIHLNGSILDTPELFWVEPQLEPLYRAVRSYLEMDQRVGLLTSRLDVIADLLAVLKEQLSHGHGEKLEWIVIILIAAEILVAAINIYVDLWIAD